MKHTPLHQAHLDLGAKMVDFGGFHMPVTYPAGVLAEHKAVRTNVGLFDVGHMGQLRLTGEQALDQLNYWFTNTFDTLASGRIRYAIMCQEDGGALDDLLVYKVSDTEYFIVVNASNIESDFEWLSSHITFDVELVNESDEWGLIAVQGPRTNELMSKVCQVEDLPQKYYSFVPAMQVAGVEMMVSQTGYTGEFGFELYIPAARTAEVWNALLEAGKEMGVEACGLGARDTLRLEAAMPLYGHELTKEISPVEADLMFAIKLNHDFIGVDALRAQVEHPVRKRVGLKVDGRGIVREDATLIDPQTNEEVGFTTSGTMAPYLGYALAMGMVDMEHAAPGTQLIAQVRSRAIECHVVELPFYKRSK